MNESTKQLCFDYFSGKSTPAQEKIISEYISTYEGKQNFREWEEEWKAQNVHSNELSLSYSLLKLRIKSKRKNRILTYSAVAASLLLIYSVSIGLIIRNTHKMVTISTAYQEKLKAVLPDNSIVWLNSQSTLSYDKKFAKENRNITLNGEAFFDVAKNPDMPFVVSAGDAQVSVKGTKFNVTAYKNEKVVMTTLIEGRVDFVAREYVNKMYPGDFINYNMEKSSLKRSKVDVSNYQSWIQDKIDFEAATLPLLFTRLSNIYGVTFLYDKDLFKDREFRVILNTNEPITNVLDAVSTMLPINWEKVSDKEYRILTK